MTSAAVPRIVHKPCCIDGSSSKNEAALMMTTSAGAQISAPPAPYHLTKVPMTCLNKLQEGRTLAGDVGQEVWYSGNPQYGHDISDTH